MTPATALVLFLFELSVPFLFQVPSAAWTSRRCRVLASLGFSALGLNRLFTSHPLQSLGVVALCAVAAAATSQRLRFPLLVVVALASPLVIDPQHTGDAANMFFGAHGTTVLLFGGGLAVALLAGSACVEAVLARIKGMPHPSSEVEGARGLPAGGMVIGFLERALVYSGVLVGHPEAAALVIAVKSVARFPEFANDRKFAEYFLVGTFVSLLVAFATAYLVQAATRSLSS